MSVHRDCGKEVRWTQRDDDPERWHPPLEFAGHAYIITEDNVAVYTATYKRHECDPDDIKAWMDLKRHQAMAKGIDVSEIDSREERALAKQQQRDRDWEQALTVECETCEAGVNVMCYNLSKRKQGIAENTKNPHPQRLWRSVDIGATT